MGAGADPFAETAKTESCLSSDWPWHDGQTAGRSADTKASKARWQSRHTYSKSGIRCLHSNAERLSMSDEANALLALKNAWTGVMSASSAVRDLDATVQSLPADTPLASLDLERYHLVALAEANAAQALRGLVEQLRAKAAPVS